MSPGSRWIAGIVLTLTGGVLAMVVLIVFAQRANAGRIVPDYYQRAARYDDAIAAADASRALGWTTTIELTSTTVHACVLDRAGAPVVGTLELTMTHRAHPGAPALLRAATDRAGCVSRPAALTPGVHDVVVAAIAGSDRFVATAVREVP